MAANVFTLMPPAVDWEPPPIHISTTNISNVMFSIDAGLTDEKPDERGTQALNTDCTTFS